MAVIRTPSGHPEGYLEAFANIYRDFAQAVRGAVPAARAMPPCATEWRGCSSFKAPAIAVLKTGRGSILKEEGMKAPGISCTVRQRRSAVQLPDRHG